MLVSKQGIYQALFQTQNTGREVHAEQAQRAEVSPVSAKGRTGWVQKQSECESESDDTHSDFLHSHSPTHTLSMFDFEKLDIYQKAKTFNSDIRVFIKTSNLDPTTKDQLRRASFSIVLNIAEGSGRFTKPDRRNFYIISRSSTFECIAILDVLKDEKVLENNQYQKFYFQAEEISKMLFAMIKNLS